MWLAFKMHRGTDESVRMATRSDVIGLITQVPNWMLAPNRGKRLCAKANGGINRGNT
jgi:hypothetical protein